MTNFRYFFLIFITQRSDPSPDEQEPLELEEVNWELFKSGRKIAYFRPLIGKSHFFQPRTISDTEDVERSPFFLRTPESETDGDDAKAVKNLADKIFHHLVDELVLEISFEITEAFLEEKIEDSKEALKDRFLIEKTDSLISEIIETEMAELIKSESHFGIKARA